MRPDVRRSIVCVTAVGLTAILSNVLDADAGTKQLPSYASYQNRPSVDLKGMFRDFEPRAFGGHPDFGVPAAAGAGRYADIPADELDSEGKPVFRTTGLKIASPAMDVEGRPIIGARPYITARPGDTEVIKSATPGGAATNAANFSQWFRNTPGVNTGQRGVVTLTREAGTGTYIFDGSLDRPGAIASTIAVGTNTAYTYELETQFVHLRGYGWYIRAATDADVWVYIDDRLVIDGGAGGGFQGARGVAADGPISLANTGRIEIAPGSVGAVSSNATAAGSVGIFNSAQIEADVRVGPGANVATAISAGAGAITGERGSLAAPVPMPVIKEPEGLGASRGHGVYEMGTFTFDSDVRFDSLTIAINATVNIEGNVTILCEGDFTLRNGSKIVLGPGATLDLYIKGATFMGQSSEVNVNTADPSRVTVYNLGGATMVLDNTAEIYANFAAPGAELRIGNAVHVHGNFIGRAFTLSNSGRFTITGSGAWGRGASDGNTAMVQHLELDRLAWLANGRTHTLKVFVADRDAVTSRLRLETNINTLNLAAQPQDCAVAYD